MSFNANPNPLVSCIMPTFNRRMFVPQAIKYFLRQDYEPKELIVVDDGTDAIGDLIPSDERVKYIRLNQRLTIGAKRNLACQQARSEIIAHWDDDDWMAGWRLSYQVNNLLNERADICGLDKVLFFDPSSDRAWEYVYTNGGKPWVYGATLCYGKGLWRRNSFPDINVGEDSRFVWSNASAKILKLDNKGLLVALVHSGNTSPKQTANSCWHPYPVEGILRLLGEDRPFYQFDNIGNASGIQPDRERISISERSISMITAARLDDLAMTEYAAFNHGQSLPWMRRWELPFAMFNSRLSSGMFVLDCTINPANFHERLIRLYPNIFYRNWNPVQNRTFVLPVNLPDQVFDRIICVNTLEHLLTGQREALICSMARKLKPGGLLALTCDYYFDSFWHNPAFLKSGVMRADRQEIFNGWNKVTLSALVDVCSKYGLHPITELIEEPREEDMSLYRQQHPYPHACIGAIFYKPPRIDIVGRKTILLALLTWNTCRVSLDSVHAYIREARMLKRLGLFPVICVCDNGSTDGTPGVLQSLQNEIDIPYKLILNRDNLGNSTARNQIIDCMIQCDADYLLLMDGDIEIVPFSSYAMFCHLENAERTLGCIGADSAGQTPHPHRATEYLYSIERAEATNLVAWTQYGMFRREVFNDGIRFDDNGPFKGAGWGFEDNDLAFQMEMKGYLNQRFLGMTYLHRSARSSIPIMRANGIDPGNLYARRRQYVIDKWATVPTISNGPLVQIKQFSTRL